MKKKSFRGTISVINDMPNSLRYPLNLYPILIISFLYPAVKFASKETTIENNQFLNNKKLISDKVFKVPL